EFGGTGYTFRGRWRGLGAAFLHGHWRENAHHVAPSKRVRRGGRDALSLSALGWLTRPVAMVVVIEDRANSLVVEDERVTTRATQIDKEGLVRFPFLVAVHHDGDGEHCLTRGER